MKKIYIIIFSLLLSSNSFAAGGDSGGSSDASLYDDAVKLVKRAGTDSYTHLRAHETPEHVVFRLLH